MTDWPCHVWLQKKLVWPTNQAALERCVTDFLCTSLGDGILCTLSPNHNIQGGGGGGGGMVFISDGQRMLWSQSFGNVFSNDLES